jgi:hypothetical protein
VDSTDGISEELALRVSQLACMLLTQVYNGTLRKKNYVYGQVGLIKRGRGTILVTSLHNLVSEDEDGSDRLTAQHAFLRLPSTEYYDVHFNALASKTRKKHLKAVDLRDGATWSYGRDIAWGRFSKIVPSTLLPPQLPAFEAVAWKKEQYVSALLSSL